MVALIFSGVITFKYMLKIPKIIAHMSIFIDEI